MKRTTVMDTWLDELIMFGYPEPITRRDAMALMVADGWTHTEAANALCYWKAVR